MHLSGMPFLLFRRAVCGRRRRSDWKDLVNEVGDFCHFMPAFPRLYYSAFALQESRDWDKTLTCVDGVEVEHVLHGFLLSISFFSLTVGYDERGRQTDDECPEQPDHCQVDLGRRHAAVDACGPPSSAPPQIVLYFLLSSFLVQ